MLQPLLGWSKSERISSNVMGLPIGGAQMGQKIHIIYDFELQGYFSL